MTDHPHDLDDITPHPLDPSSSEASDWPNDHVEAVFITRLRPSTTPPGDRYDLGALFLCWSWGAGYSDWHDGLRALARALRGLEDMGFIERRTIRQPAHQTQHGFVITDAGRDAIAALSGDWIAEGDR